MGSTPALFSQGPVPGPRIDADSSSAGTGTPFGIENPPPGGLVYPSNTQLRRLDPAPCGGSHRASRKLRTQRSARSGRPHRGDPRSGGAGYRGSGRGDGPLVRRRWREAVRTSATRHLGRPLPRLFPRPRTRSGAFTRRPFACGGGSWGTTRIYVPSRKVYDASGIEGLIADLPS